MKKIRTAFTYAAYAGFIVAILSSLAAIVCIFTTTSYPGAIILTAFKAIAIGCGFILVVLLCDNFARNHR